MVLAKEMTVNCSIRKRMIQRKYCALCACFLSAQKMRNKPYFWDPAARQPCHWNRINVRKNICSQIFSEFPGTVLFVLSSQLSLCGCWKPVIKCNFTGQNSGYFSWERCNMARLVWFPCSSSYFGHWSWMSQTPSDYCNHNESPNAGWAIAVLSVKTLHWCFCHAWIN